MPLSQLDANAALIVVDLQKGIVALPTAHDTADIVARSASLARAFRVSGRPVVLVHVSGVAPGRTDAGPRELPTDPSFFEFVPEIEQAPSDHVVEKKRWGAFHGTDLDVQLRRRGIRTIVLGGVATQIGVESTARQAWEHGYELVIVKDATTSMAAEPHEMSMKHILPRISRLTESAQIALR